MRRQIATVLGLLFLFTTCTKDKAPMPLETKSGSGCDSTHVYFENSILPLISSNCAKSGCHDATTHEEGYVFSTYSGISSAVDAGKPDHSKLYEAITETGGDMMPPSGNTPLTAEQKDLIYRWISQGALNDKCEQDTSASSCDSQNVSYSTTIATIISSNCAGCHSGSAPSGGLNFTTHSGLSVVAADGRLVNAVSHNGQAQNMPPTGSLSSCDIKKIKSWVDAGHPNN